LYIYDAVGTKLRKTVSGITTDYAGNYVYENGTLQFFNTAEGYVEPNGTGWQYVYQYKDHLGNVRLSYADADGNGVIVATGPGAEIREENNYYPFGLQHKGYNNVVNGTENNYQTYNGKELSESLGVNWLEYGARNYMPDIGRYYVIDNFSEAYYHINPYQYTANNPIKFIDVNGDYIYINDVDAGKRYRYENGQLYEQDENEDWVEATAASGSYAAQIVDALGDITGGDENSFGSQFLSLFENDDVNVTLADNKSTNSNTKDRNITQGTDIYTSFNQNERIPTTNGLQAQSFHITLGHELAHGLANNILSKTELRKPWVQANSSNGLPKDIPQSEVFASMYENMLRSEQGLPLRTHYSPTNDGSVVSESRLIKKVKGKVHAISEQWQPTKGAVQVWNNLVKTKKK